MRRGGSSSQTSGSRARSWPTTRRSRSTPARGSQSPRVIWPRRGRLHHDDRGRNPNPSPHPPGRLRPMRHLHGGLPGGPRDPPVSGAEAGRPGGAAVPFGRRGVGGRLDRALHGLPPLRHGLPRRGSHLRAEPPGKGEIPGRTREGGSGLAPRPERPLRRAGRPVLPRRQPPDEEPRRPVASRSVPRDRPAADACPPTSIPRSGSGSATRSAPAAERRPAADRLLLRLLHEHQRGRRGKGRRGAPRGARLHGNRPAPALLRHPPPRRRGPPGRPGDGKAETSPCSCRRCGRGPISSSPRRAAA